MNKDFSLQGKIYLGTRLAGGLPGAMFWVGDAPKCDISLKTDSETRRESYSGNRLPSARLQKGNEATVALTLNWMNADNLCLGLYGSKVTVASGSVSGETMPDDLAVGDYVVLDRPVSGSLVVTDSNGTPATLTLDTHYEVISENVLKILNLGSFTQPFKAAYSAKGSVDVAMFTVSPPERYLFLDGINTLTGEKVLCRLYRVQFDPAGQVPGINEGFGQLELSGSALYDDEAALDEELGGFGKIVQPT